MNKIIVVHPGRQHSYMTAEALKKAALLDYYVTTVYRKKHSLTSLFGSLLRGDNKKRFLARHNDIFDADVKQYYEFLGLLVLLLERSKKTKSLADKIDSYIHKHIYFKAIKLAKKSRSLGVIVYGGLSQKHIDFAKRIYPELKIIVDVPIASNYFWVESIKHDLRVFPDNVFAKQEAKLLSQTDYQASYGARNADYFLAGSNVVKKSLELYGIECKKIRVIPYGVDTSVFSYKMYKCVDIVNFVFVGQVTRRKGVHHLLKEFVKFSKDEVHLTLVGKYDPEDPLYIEYSKYSNIVFAGMVTKNKVVDFYKSSDVFVLPSLCEGLAQVGIEAMACGLPIICSDHSGLDDLIENGKQGFVVETSNDEQLFNSMNWFVLNKDKIEEMGKAAYKVGHALTWERYQRQVADEMGLIMNGENNG